MMQPNLANTMYFRWLDQQRQDQLAKQGLEAQQAQTLSNEVRQDTDEQQKLQRAMAAKQALAAAVQSYQGGDKSPLLQSDPEIGLKFEAQGEKAAHDRATEAEGTANVGIARAKLGLEGSKAQVEKAQRTANAQRALETANPLQRPALMRTLQGMAANGLIDLPGEVGTGIGQEQTLNPDKPTNDMTEFAAMSGLHPGDPAYQAKFQAWLREMANLKAPKTTTNVNLPGGGMKLTAAETTDQQKSVLHARSALAQLDQYDNIVKAAGGDDQFGGLVDQYIKSPAQQLGVSLNVSNPSTTRRIAMRSQAEATLSTLTNTVLHDLSGAAITPQEFKRFQTSLPSINDAPPIRRAKILAWRQNLQLIQQQGIDALVQGIRSNKVALPNEEMPVKDTKEQATQDWLKSLEQEQ